MANLTFIEKKKLEAFLQMGNGFIFDFTNQSFREFTLESTGIDIYDPKYDYGSNSKANRLRKFWDVEPNHVVSKLLYSLAKYWREFITDLNWISDEEYREYTFFLSVAERLKTQLGEHVDAIQPNTEEEDFIKLAKVIRESIERNEPETALDRLHTFLVKHLQILCEKHDVHYDKTTPLHSLLGGYIKHLKTHNLLESQMSERILKSSISVLEQYNDVRNNQSYAHPNSLLNYNESLLIFKNISALIEFLDAIEAQFTTSQKQTLVDDLPF